VEGRSEKEVTAGPEVRGRRLDVFLFEQGLFPSRAQAQKAVAAGRVTVNGVRVKAGYRLRPKDRVSVHLEPPEPSVLVPEDIPLEVVYEDSDLLVINKPQGLVVHPAPGHPRGTLVNALLRRCPDLSGIGGSLRPGVVHRLDKDTSGLMVVAKNDFTHLELARQLQERTLRRVYLALVHGRPPLTGTVRAPVGRHQRDRKKMAVRTEGGKEAVTHYRVREYFPDYALLEVSLETGRTHQIRVHLASLGHPVVGDPLYGRRRPPLPVPGQLLHACRLAFRHPRNGERLEFTAPLPPAFEEVLRHLRRQDPPREAVSRRKEEA
jgi:23S rRNA pseudouridine1911/1915/1917 synthase